jgi:hypothetical protein
MSLGKVEPVEPESSKALPSCLLTPKSMPAKARNKMSLALFE